MLDADDEKKIFWKGSQTLLYNSKVARVATKLGVLQRSDAMAWCLTDAVWQWRHPSDIIRNSHATTSLLLLFRRLMHDLSTDESLLCIGCVVDTSRSVQGRRAIGQ